MRATRPLALLLAACAALLGSACTDNQGGDGRSVVASVYPLAFIAEQIAGGEIEVRTLTPPGGEPHDLELTPSHARSIVEAGLVLYVGGGFQPAVEDAVEQSDNGLDVLDLVTTIEAHEVEEASETETEHDEETEEDGHEHEGTDPHVWLDPTQAALIADSVLERLKAIAPEHGDLFDERHSDLKTSLEELDLEISSGLEKCDERTIVVAHEAFGYLVQRYDLEQIGIAGIDPEQEPSPQRMAEVARFVSENSISTIYLERAVTREVGMTLAEETGANVSYLDPLEMEPEEGDYFSAMRANLETLQLGLGCGGSV